MDTQPRERGHKQRDPTCSGYSLEQARGGLQGRTKGDADAQRREAHHSTEIGGIWGKSRGQRGQAQEVAEFLDSKARLCACWVLPVRVFVFFWGGVPITNTGVLAGLAALKPKKSTKTP